MKTSSMSSNNLKSSFLQLEAQNFKLDWNISIGMGIYINIQIISIFIYEPIFLYTHM